MFNNSRLVKQFIGYLFWIMKYYDNIKCYWRKIFNGMEKYAILSEPKITIKYVEICIKEKLGENPSKY